ncbi:hypothetical protein [Soonwooa sp.]|uniref:hypothetical protein n=1 Tax=Soonwooa sp. TaxID=1938592 RepID=UPI0028A98369|nr:hypothetical protein [Soonwooa sp.]
MVFFHKNIEYNFPSSLSEFTLGQRIAFDNMYSDQIKELQESVFKKDENGEDIEADEIDVMLMTIAIASMNFSFFSGIPLQEVQDEISVDDVLNVYYACFHQINEQQESLELESEFVWNDEIWNLEAPELSYESKITFNELITSKQIVKQMSEVSASNWQGLLFLCAIYLKKENEVFNEAWMQENSERVQLMKSLPMDIALHVAFFLQSSMTSYMKTFQSLKAVELAKDPI